MKLEPFALERWQSIWENRVAWNLSESGVHPLRLEELAVSDAERRAVLTQELGYTQTNGTPELAQAIASLYRARAPTTSKSRTAAPRPTASRSGTSSNRETRSS